MKKKHTLHLLIFFLLVSAGLMQAQNATDALKPITGTYAITNVTIIQEPGKMTERGTIIIQDGLIDAVGTKITIPNNAKIIKGDSMFVYPGFIGGLSNIGIPKPEAPQGGRRPEVKNPGEPGNKLAGIQPEVEVKDVLSMKDKSISDMRKLGFTSAHVVPRGRMLPGSGAIIMLNGTSPDDMIVKAQSSMYSQLLGSAGRVYPSTIIGVMSKWRELYKRAQQAKAHEQRYSTNPAGMQRPSYDRSLQAFYPVIDGTMPVFFKASDVKTAYRVLALQKDLEFPLVLGDLKQGWHLTDEIKSNKIPVFLSLDLPEEKKEKDKKDGEEMTNAEKEQLEKRKAETLKQYQSQAATFEKAGIPFGFSLLNTKAKDIRGNLRTMIENGLSEETALAALTTTPAQLLGISNMVGTVEKGKIANLLVTDAPYFEENSNVRFVFIDGTLFEYEAKPKKKAGDPNVKAVVGGSWSYVIKTPDQERAGVLKITDNDGDLSGSISSTETGDTTEIEAAELSGNALTFIANVSMGPQSIKLDFNLIIDGDTMEGSVSVGEFGTFDVEGSKDSTPE